MPKTINKKQEQHPGVDLEQKKKKFLPIKLEYPESIMEQLHEIGERFRKRYDELVDKGHFKDLQEEFQNVMDSDASDGTLEVDLSISLDGYLDFHRLIPIRQSIIRFDKSGKFTTYRDKSFACSYLLDGRIVVANNEICPACGSEWENKLFNETCPHCENVVGEDIFFIIEDDRCPHCNHKGITESDMKCRGCKKVIPEGSYVILPS